MKKITNYHRVLYLINFFALIGLISVSFLADYLPINGNTSGEVASKFQPLFNPAGFTSTIWIVIYTSLVLYMIYLLNGIRDDEGISSFVTARVGLTFLISCLANAGWVIAWHYEQITTTVVLLIVLLLALIDINRRIRKIEQEIPSRSWKFTLFVKMPFAMYLGWICIAIITNISIFFVSNESGTFGLTERAWTTLFILFSGFLGLYLMSWLRSWIPAIAIGWGIVGILYNYWQDSSFIFIQIAAIFSLAILGIGAAKSYRKIHSFNYK